MRGNQEPGDGRLEIRPSPDPFEGSTVRQAAHLSRRTSFRQRTGDVVFIFSYENYVPFLRLCGEDATFGRQGPKQLRELGDGVCFALLRTMLGPRLALLSLILLPQLAGADPMDGPPGLSPSRLPAAELFPPSTHAPIQAERPPGLAMLREIVHKQELHLRDEKIVIDLDGSVTVTPLHAAFTLRFGARSPYSLQARRALESTFDERSQMSARYREAALQFALADLPNYLNHVWRHPGWSIATRKRILFALWDECAERGSASVVAAGGQARLIIEAFIRWRLPEASPDRFHPLELSELNRRRSARKRFAPYQKSLEIPGRMVVTAMTF